MTNFRVIDILRKTRELLSHGWCQYRQVRIIEGVTCRCLSQALFEAGQQAPPAWRRGAANAIRKAIVRREGYTPTARLSVRIDWWNDATGRTKGEVLDLIDDARLIPPAETT